MWLPPVRSGSHETAVTLPPGADRRWSRIMRMSCNSAIATMNAAGIAQLDGIYWGTGLGCLEDTEKFLSEINTITGSPLSPTPFMRSTHNTMAGQLAMVLGSRGPNITVSQHFFSFHLALLHALLHLRENPEDNVLVGAADERTDLVQRIASALATGRNIAPVAVGEGAASFLFSGDRLEGSTLRVVDVWISEVADATTWSQRMTEVDVDPDAITIAWLGDDPVTHKRPWAPKGSKVELYRPTTGLHHSAASQAFGLAVDALRSSTSDPTPARAIVADRVGDREALILIERC